MPPWSGQAPRREPRGPTEGSVATKPPQRETPSTASSAPQRSEERSAGARPRRRADRPPEGRRQTPEPTAGSALGTWNGEPRARADDRTQSRPRAQRRPTHRPRDGALPRTDCPRRMGRASEHGGKRREREEGAALGARRGSPFRAPQIRKPKSWCK